MAARDNIVKISRTDLFEHKTRISEADIPELIHSAKRIARKELRTLLQKMFDNVDDCLFEYADKADNNQQQMHYFDAMREVRLQKESMATVFHREFDKLYKQALCGEASSLDPLHSGSTEVSFATLSLVEEDDLELSLAVTNMVTKIQTLYREPISALVRRMDHVLEGMGLTSEQFPLSGKVVCDSFSAAINTLSADVQVKLIIYKLFDKFVAQQLGRIYNEVNAMFVAAGVLPQIRIKAPVNNAAHQRQSDYIENEMLSELQDTLLHPNGEGGEQDVANVFNVMQKLLTRNRSSGAMPRGMQGQGGAGGAGYSGTGGGMAGGAMAGGAAMASANGAAHAAGMAAGHGAAGAEGADGIASVPVMGTYVAQDVISGLSGIQQSADVVSLINTKDQPTGELIKTVLVKELSKNSDDAGAKAIDHAESDAIDIVSMLFDFILDDKTLPDRLKALIGRLQIPLVKVAILDNSFFGKKAHPARQLLNELAYAASGSEEGLDSGDDTLYETIEEIVNRILNEFECDVSLFEELLTEFRDYQEREYEANRMAEEMLEQTKENVAHEIEHRIRNNRVPEVICRLLLEQWKDVMTVIGIRDGAEGDSWNAALNVMDDLIWSVQPKLVVQEKSQLTRVIPRILNGLQDGLTMVDYGQDNINTLFEGLEQLHHESLRGLREVGASRGADADAMEEIVLQDDTPDDSPLFNTIDPVLLESEYYYLVKGMETGTWLEFISEDRSQRGKLAWKCDFTNEYTFVDRRYKLVADISMAELIQRLEEGSIAIVDEVPLFDRAIDAVVKGLKQCLSSDEHLPESVPG